MRYKIALATAWLISCALLSQAQVDRCGTDLMNQNFAQSHPERVEYQGQMRELIRNAAIEQGGERNTIIIPTVVHILHKGGPENITNEQVFDAMRVLNEDLRRINSDTGNTRTLFKPFGADFNVEFRLAQIDPNGNCTNGITNTFSPITNQADDNIKSTALGGIDAWPVNRYFNIWVVGRIQIDQSNVIGYAYFPSWGISSSYGVVINNKYFGTIGSAQGEDGRTLTHEVGHCLELYHTFQSGCGGNCSTTGDQVCDTPPSSSATYACNHTINTCGNDQSGPSPYNTNVADMVENYMSYNQGFCQNIFTKGQKQRSDAVLQNTFLAQLITPQNLAATGTSDGFMNVCELVPEFNWSKSVICVGDSIRFFDFTQNGQPGSYQWSITGPQNLSATVANPSVTFNQAGVYSVTLTVTNAAGTESVSKQNIIRVTDTATASPQFTDGFDFHPIVGGRWQVSNPPYGYGWEEKVTGSGNATVYINNVNNDDANIIYELYSPLYDLSDIDDPKFRFKTAYAQKNGTSSDRLRVYFSKDCGKTWILRFSKTGSMLASMPAGNSPVEPNSLTDWATWEIDVPQIMEGATHFMVKFTFETGRGNNIYLDAINLDGLTSVEEPFQMSALPIYPNPSPDYFQVDLSTMEGELQLTVYDMGGRIVSNQNVIGGTELSLSAKSLGLAAGMYRLSVMGKSGMLSGKIIVSE